MLVDAGAFGHKFQSKSEVYRFLTHDCGTYLPKYQSCTIYHMRDLVAGRKTRIKETSVKHMTIPHFKGLKIEAMLEYSEDKPHVMACLPAVQHEREALPRQYVSNVIYTKVGADFKKWVDEIVNIRHELVRQTEDQIQMDPEIAAIFNSSNAIAVNKGVSNNLMKAGSKRRRTKTEIEREKLEGELKRREIEESMQQFGQMQQEISQLRQSQQIPADYHEIKDKVDRYEGLEAVIDNLKKRGYIKLGDNNTVNVSQDAQEQMDFMNDVHLEEREALKAEMLNNELARNGIDQERKRADQQLEPNEEMVAHIENLFSNSSGLRDSVILVDHQDASSGQQLPGQIDSGSNVNQKNNIFK